MKSIYPFKISLIISLFLILSNLINAQIVYTDITPDHAIITNENLSIDLNGDDSNDVTFEYEYYSSQYQTWAKTNIHLSMIEVVLPTSSFQFNLNDTIGEDLTWYSFNTAYLQIVVDGYYDGPWNEIQDGFVPFKLYDDGQYYYGWIRLHIIDNNQYKLAVAGYAINTQANQAILTGEGMPLGATSLSVFTTDTHLDGRDINLSFTTAFDENLFSEYRIFVAKSDDENATNIEYLSQLSDEFYKTITAENHYFSSVALDLSSNTISIDNEPIIPLQDYRIYILNVSETGDLSMNVLSNPSEIIHLETTILPIEDLSSRDINNLGNASDIKVEFKNPEENIAIEEFRIFIIKTTNINDFTLEQALALPQEYYTYESSSTGTHSLFLNSNQLDTNGEEIENGETYSAMILSVANNITTNTSILSPPTQKIKLANPNTFYAGQTTGDNIHHYYYDTVFSELEYWGATGWQVYSGTSYIDINRDGIDDFELYAFSDGWAGPSYNSYNSGETISGLRNNKVLICEHPNHNNWVAVISLYDQIFQDYTFTNTTATLDRFVFIDYFNIYNDEPSVDLGHYPGYQEEYYIAVELNDEDEPNYAWIKLEGFKFLEYAYQDLSGGNTLDSCITEGIQFSNQADLELFIIDYPNCKHIKGEVIFEGEDITNLDAFNNIISLDGNLIIRNCPQLSDINGLQNLELNTLNSIEITNNQNLSECDIENICQYLSDNGNIFIENNKEGCQDNAEVKSICTSSLAELKTYNWEIKPNPANQFVNISTISNIKIKSTLKIVNSLGSVVDEFEMNNSDLGINIENYPAGLYFVKIINSDGQIEIHKLIVK